jgi:hypothetical protein
MKKLSIAALVVLVLMSASAGLAEAASTSKKKAVKHRSRSDYTAEQRHKILLYALEICRKKYGRTSLRHAEIDYSHNRVRCYIY